MTYNDFDKLLSKKTVFIPKLADFEIIINTRDK